MLCESGFAEPKNNLALKRFRQHQSKGQNIYHEAGHLREFEFWRRIQLPKTADEIEFAKLNLSEDKESN